MFFKQNVKYILYTYIHVHIDIQACMCTHQYIHAHALSIYIAAWNFRFVNTTDNISLRHASKVTMAYVRDYSLFTICH